MSDHPKFDAQVKDSTTSVDLGDEVHDKVTGYSGVVTAIAVFDHTGPRVLVENISGGEIHSEYIDASRVDLG